MSVLYEDITRLTDRVHALETHGIPGVVDFFATSALSFLARENTIYMPAKDIASKAYDIAEAMVEERKLRGYNAG